MSVRPCAGIQRTTHLRARTQAVTRLLRQPTEAIDRHLRRLCRSLYQLPLQAHSVGVFFISLEASSRQFDTWNTHLAMFTPSAWK